MNAKNGLIHLRTIRLEAIALIARIDKVARMALIVLTAAVDTVVDTVVALVNVFPFQPINANSLIKLMILDHKPHKPHKIQNDRLFNSAVSVWKQTVFAKINFVPQKPKFYSKIMLLNVDELTRTRIFGAHAQHN